MTTTAPSATPTRTTESRSSWLLLILGGIAFFAGGALHPKGSDHGDKSEQLHSMLVDSLWYPAHTVMLLAMAGIAAALVILGRRTELPSGVARVVRVLAVVAVIGALGAVIHLFAATQSDAIEDGGTSFLVLVFTGVETVVNPLWGLAIATLAVVGGVTRTVGNRIVLALGLVGGLAFALATATIAFTDLFDPIFPVASLIGVWCVATGVVGLVRGR
ncbi:hypothetical protein [Nocardioides antri]|uniref:DUF4386 family protein n=1 Tax=Nocardioides antri TaxID=2607659 RepID=A0A5B1M6C2_9ACTN|nr:hypothetical protein [Nocardioides antri]KAA1427230.1 hypothetical protein F0U47_06915 [Nocardioides antri]